MRFVHGTKYLIHCITKRLRVAGATGAIGTFSKRSVGGGHNWEGCASEGEHAWVCQCRWVEPLRRGSNRSTARPPSTGDLAIERHQPCIGGEIQRVSGLTPPGKPETLHRLD